MIEMSFKFKITVTGERVEDLPELKRISDSFGKVGSLAIAIAEFVNTRIVVWRQEHNCYFLDWLECQVLCHDSGEDSVDIFWKGKYVFGWDCNLQGQRSANAEDFFGEQPGAESFSAQLEKNFLAHQLDLNSCRVTPTCDSRWDGRWPDEEGLAPTFGSPC